jgi:hypothetical protein
VSLDESAQIMREVQLHGFGYRPHLSRVVAWSHRRDISEEQHIGSSQLRLW